MNPIKVMVVDDAAVVRQVVAGLLGAAPGIEVIAAVADPLPAIERLKRQWPDVIVLDVEMPRMDGITFPSAAARSTSSRSRDFEGYQILECERAGIATMVPKPLTSNSKFEGRFDKRDFIYDGQRDEYRCPAGKTAIYRFTAVEDGKTLRKYWSSACGGCPLKPKCTPAPNRRISRWEHESVLEVVQARLDNAPGTSRLRGQTVEHVFGTLKAWMGSTHFLTRTLPRVRTEMSLQVLAYNLQRAIKIVGARTLIAEIRA